MVLFLFCFYSFCRFIISTNEALQN